jgi:hypothetical protein
MNTEGKQGSIAKRWSRRTRRNVEGKMSSEALGRFFRLAVSPEPERRSRASPARETAIAGQARVISELLAETNEPNTTSELLIFVSVYAVIRRHFGS